MNPANDKAIKTLKTIYRDSLSKELKIAIIEGLGEAGGDDAIDYLKTIYRDSLHTELKTVIFRAIGRAGRII
ncbi:HEAT repeat domain-containing protein (plasmid) [Orbus wheelerorum]|uniref:HEAT repeat domain-containing protein n=1 Tax=Orbus wheelerorum TaxID=3074111 RepID=UPI00370D76C8